MKYEFSNFIYRPVTETSSIDRCGVLLARHFLRGEPLLLDADGVIVRSDALFSPRQISPSLVTVIKEIESLDIQVGLATARSEQFVEYLRAQGLRMQGPLILQEGQLLVADETRTYFVHELYRDFIHAAKSVVSKHSAWRESWYPVWSSGLKDMVFCPGNRQWQGDSRASFWFYTDGDLERNTTMKEALLDPMIDVVGESFGLERNVDFTTSLGLLSLANHGKAGFLGMVSIKGMRNGTSIDKSVAADLYGRPVVFVADGVGDVQLGKWNRGRGINIAIEGNLDVSSDPDRFYRLSELILRNPSELAMSLFHAARIIEQSR